MPVYNVYTQDFLAGFYSFWCVYLIFTCSDAFFLPLLLLITMLYIISFSVVLRI